MPLKTNLCRLCHTMYIPSFKRQEYCNDCFINLALKEEFEFEPYEQQKTR